MTDITDKSGTVSGHVRKVSATERLSALLTERGVEWDKGAFPNEAHTYWQDAVAKPWNEQCLFVMALLTPEQAVAATLGPGTCHDVSRTHGRWTCSECVVTAERTEIAGDYSDRRTARLDGIATREVLEAFLHMAEGVLS